MKEFILQLIKESQEPAFNKMQLTIFKYLNKKKKTLGTKNKMIEAIKGLLKTMGLNPNEAMYYYNTFTLNYRPNGDYESITKDELIGPEEFPKTRTANINSGEYVSSKIPFIGNNLEGKWEKDRNGESQYVVLSYGWWPVMIFKNNQWYTVIQGYSSSTSKQKSQAGRGVQKFEYLNDYEMKQLRSGANLNMIEKNRLRDFEESETSWSPSTLIYTTVFPIKLSGVRKYVVYYRIKNAKVEGDKIVFDIEIDRAGDTESDSSRKVKDAYDPNNEPQRMTVEDAVISNVIANNKLLNSRNTEFKFKHKEKKDRIVESSMDVEYLKHFQTMGVDKKTAKTNLKDLKEYIKNLPEELKLYRIIAVDTKDEINHDEPGSHYSQSKKDLLSSHHYITGSGEHYYLITVIAPKKLVDKTETIINNILYPNEQEITLKNKGRGTKISSIKKIK